jgi:hypothetical protein
MGVGEGLGARDSEEVDDGSFLEPVLVEGLRTTLGSFGSPSTMTGSPSNLLEIPSSVGLLGGTATCTTGAFTPPLAPTARLLLGLLRQLPTVPARISFPIASIPFENPS